MKYNDFKTLVCSLADTLTKSGASLAQVRYIEPYDGDTVPISYIFGHLSTNCNILDDYEFVPDFSVLRNGEILFQRTYDDWDATCKISVVFPGKILGEPFDGVTRPDSLDVTDQSRKICDILKISPYELGQKIDNFTDSFWDDWLFVPHTCFYLTAPDGQEIAIDYCIEI